MIRPLILFALVAIAAPAWAETVEGAARVKDGDSLVIAGTDVRLAGIDAPEARQGRAARHARLALLALVGRHSVRCEGDHRDQYGRLVGRCFAGGQDISAALVGAGAAFAYWPWRDKALGRLPCPRRGLRECTWTTATLLAAEDRARAAGKGLWGMRPLPDYPAWVRHPDRRPVK